MEGIIYERKQVARDVRSAYKKETMTSEEYNKFDNMMEHLLRVSHREMKAQTGCGESGEIKRAKAKKEKGSKSDNRD